MKLVSFSVERHLMAAVAFGEGRLPRHYHGGEPLQGHHFITDSMAPRTMTL
jgi:hypothetical protein